MFAKTVDGPKGSKMAKSNPNKQHTQTAVAMTTAPGPITAACTLRDSIVAFKADSIYVGDYIGDTTNGIIWGWRLISDKIGCSAPHGVALLNDKLYFVHRSNVYEFDGAAVRPIGMPVINTLVNGLMTGSGSLAYMQAIVDQREGLVFWFYPSQPGSPSVLDYALAYNVFTGQFGTVTSSAVKSTGTAGTDYYTTCAVTLGGRPSPTIPLPIISNQIAVRTRLRVKIPARNLPSSRASR